MQVEITVTDVTLGLVCHGGGPLSEFINSGDVVFSYDSICLWGLTSDQRLALILLLVAMEMGDRVHDASPLRGGVTMYELLL